MNAAQKHITEQIIGAIRGANEKDAESVKTLGTKLEELGGLLRDLADVPCSLPKVETVSVGTQTTPNKVHFIPQDPPSQKQKSSKSLAKKPISKRPCEFCRQLGHQPEKCAMPTKTRVQILKMRGACMKCCMVHQSAKCPEMRRVCKECPKSNHLQWLCPAIKNFYFLEK